MMEKREDLESERKRKGESVFKKNQKREKEKNKMTIIEKESKRVRAKKICETSEHFRSIPWFVPVTDGFWASKFYVLLFCLENYAQSYEKSSFFLYRYLSDLSPYLNIT